MPIFASLSTPATKLPLHVMVDPFGIVMRLTTNAAAQAVPSGGGTDWTLVLAIIGTVAGAISAVAVLCGAVYWLRTRRARAERVQREQRLTVDVTEAGEAIGELSGLVTSLVEEVRGRSPHVQLRFRINGVPSQRAVAVIPAVPAVDADAIVQAERDAVLATRLPLGYGAPSRPQKISATGSLPAASGALDALRAIQKTMGSLGFAGGQEKYLPVAQEDHDKFDESIAAYEEELRSFISAWIEFLGKRRLVLAVRVQIDNDGGAPAEDARIKIRFPDPCHAAEFPERPKLPRRPTFTRRLNPLHSSNRYGLAAGLTMPHMPALDIGHFNPPVINLNHSGPYYDDGSLNIRYTYRSLPHHEAVVLEPFIVGVPEPGVHEARWTIGAKNLAHLEEGTLQLEVRHEQPDPTPVATFAELVKTRHAGN